MATTSDGESDGVGDDLELTLTGSLVRNTANSLLMSLGVDAGEVTEFRAEIKTENGDETVTTIESDGPHAGLMVKNMIGSVDWDENPPKQVDVSLVTGNGNSTSEPSLEEPVRSTVPTNDDEDSTTDEAPDVYENGDTRLSAGTNMHIALTAFACYYSKQGAPKIKVNDAIEGFDDDGDDNGTEREVGVTIAEILEVVDVDLSSSQMTKAFYRLRDHDLVRVIDPHGDSYRYSITDLGWDALATIGPSAEVEEFEFDKEALQDRDFGREGARGERERDGYGTADRGEHGREEPDVEAPKPVKKGTRKHEVLTMLDAMADEYGKDHWVSIEGLYDTDMFVHDFPTKTALSTAASELFLQHAQCERKKATTKHGGGVRCLYRISDSGRAELNRIGRADVT